MTKIKTARLLLLKFISERMSETGVSQLKLSELTGINQANLSKILSGKNTPTLDTFIKLCQALEIRIFLESKTEDKEANEARAFLNEILEGRKGKEPIEQTKKLKDKCPTCGDKLYAYWHTPVGNQPELGTWHVECNGAKCNYKYDDCFPDLEWLAKEFNIL